MDKEKAIRSLSTSDLHDLAADIRIRVGESMLSYRSYREAIEETADEYMAVINDELAKRNEPLESLE